MNNIFISYAKEDTEFANNIRLSLKSEGFSVWWDNNIAAGNPWEKAIADALKNADIVLVLWTKKSKISDWVKHEASVASLTDKLLQIRVGELSVIPVIFQSSQALNFTNWNMRETHPDFIELLNTIRIKLKSKNNLKFFKKALFVVIVLFFLYLLIGFINNNLNYSQKKNYLLSMKFQIVI